MPWLMDTVGAKLTQEMISRHLLDAVIQDVVRSRAEQYSQLHATEMITSQPDEPVVDTTICDENDDKQQACSIVL